MNPGLFIAYIGAWFVCSLLSGMSEMSYMGSRSTPTIWNYIFETFIQTDSSAGYTDMFFIFPTDFITALWNTLSWNFAYLQGDWVILRVAYVVIFSVPLAFFLILAFLKRN